MEAVQQFVSEVREQVSTVVVGQDDMLNQCMLVLLCKGHVLLEGVPGIAKTLTVKTLARVLRLQFQRVQCTSDLMPADILGTNVLNMSNSSFQLHKGPVFTDLLLVDEVNRMPPRTQAALLECMEEQQVTIDGARHPLTDSIRVRHAESGRVRRHLSTARSAAGSILVEDPRRLSVSGGGTPTTNQIQAGIGFARAVEKPVACKLNPTC